ncbi:MAG: hypothetical protein IJ890_05685 [Clostridia bacterium]|nr:hypothetical protein [Clostridia bacterium]
MNILEILKQNKDIEKILNLDFIEIILDYYRLLIFHDKQRKLNFQIQRINDCYWYTEFDDNGEELCSTDITHNSVCSTLNEEILRRLKFYYKDLLETKTIAEILRDNGVKNEKILNDYKNVIIHKGADKLLEIRFICDYVINDKDFISNGSIFYLIGYCRDKKTVKLMDKTQKYVYMTLEEFRVLTREVK